MRSYFVIILLIVQYCLVTEAKSQKQKAPVPSVPVNYSLSEMELNLYNLINQYRSGYNLPPIPLSRSLSFVASTHVKDLFFNHPDQAPCNFHSWSARGQWKPFCYPRDEKKNSSVWDKPKELTGYKGKGYEIIYWENNPVNIDSIIPFWNSIDYFNSFLLNTGKWQDKKWMAIGIGIYENYAAAWFGELPDIEGTPPPATKINEEPAQIRDTVNLKPKSTEKTRHSAPTPEISTPSSGTFYIIISSQQPRAKSNKLAEELIVKGYPDAKVLVKNNKVRVSIAELHDQVKADSMLREVRKIYKDAWILK